MSFNPYSMENDSQSESESDGVTAGGPSDMNEKGIDWKWAHLGTDVCCGPDQIHGLFLPKTGVHWNFEKEKILAGAQLVKIYEKGPNHTPTDVSSWTHQKIQSFLNRFLQTENGPTQRLLVFRNQSNYRMQNHPQNKRIMNGNPHRYGNQPSPIKSISNDVRNSSSNANTNVNTTVHHKTPVTHHQNYTQPLNNNQYSSAPRNNNNSQQQSRHSQNSGDVRSNYGNNDQNRNESSRPYSSGSGGGYGGNTYRGTSNRGYSGRGYSSNREYSSNRGFSGRGYSSNREYSSNRGYSGRGYSSNRGSYNSGYSGNNYNNNSYGRGGGGGGYRGGGRGSYHSYGNRNESSGGYGGRGRGNRSTESYSHGSNDNRYESEKVQADVRNLQNTVYAETDEVPNDIIHQLSFQNSHFSVNDIKWMKSKNWCLVEIKEVLDDEQFVVRILGSNANETVDGQCLQNNAPDEKYSMNFKQFKQCLKSIKNELLLHANKCYSVFEMGDNSISDVYEILGDMGDIYINKFIDECCDTIDIILTLNDDDLKNTLNMKLGHRKRFLKIVSEINFEEYEEKCEQRRLRKIEEKEKMEREKLEMEEEKERLKEIQEIEEKEKIEKSEVEKEENENKEEDENNLQTEETVISKVSVKPVIVSAVVRKTNRPPPSPVSSDDDGSSSEEIDENEPDFDVYARIKRKKNIYSQPKKAAVSVILSSMAVQKTEEQKDRSGGSVDDEKLLVVSVVEENDDDINAGGVKIKSIVNDDEEKEVMDKSHSSSVESDVDDEHSSVEQPKSKTNDEEKINESGGTCVANVSKVKSVSLQNRDESESGESESGSESEIMEGDGNTAGVDDNGNDASENKQSEEVFHSRVENDISGGSVVAKDESDVEIEMHPRDSKDDSESEKEVEEEDEVVDENEHDDGISTEI